RVPVSIVPSPPAVPVFHFFPFSFECYLAPRALLSFPTRRSSDLPADAHHVGAAQINLFRLRGHGILNLSGKAVAVKWGSWWPRQGKVTCWCRGSVSG